MSKDSSYFQDCWLVDDRFKDWISETQSRTEARCKLCKKTITLSNMGVQALKSHADGKKHKEHCMKVSVFLRKETKPTTESESALPSTSKQQTMERSVSKAQSTSAEIRWTLQTALKGFSNNSANKITALFKAMFVYGIAPYCNEMLKKEVGASDFYTVMFDESLNSVTQSSQMDILVRFWDNTTNAAKIRFWKTTYLGHATHKDLHDGFTKATADLDISKMVQLSMDGPSVNWKFAECLLRDRNEIGLPGVINFGSCSLHIVNGAFQTGATTTAWNLKKILKAMWQILHDSPARRDDFVSVSELQHPLGRE